MFSHIVVGSNDLARAKIFYDAVFGALGTEAGVYDALGRLVYTRGGARFIVTKPIDGAPAHAANGATIGFDMTSPEQTEAWHAAGVANGGTAIENAPGVRHTHRGDIFLAYLRDPDGNKLCGLHRLG